MECGEDVLVQLNECLLPLLPDVSEPFNITQLRRYRGFSKAHDKDDLYKDKQLEHLLNQSDLGRA